MQDHATYLKRAFENGKLSHAYLFSGNDKKRKLECVNEFIGFIAGDEHQNLAHADLRFLEPEKGEITIGQMRDLQRFASLSAWQLPLKVVVIEHAERMNQQAQSAFLKLLEEPKGPMVLFLLVPHEGAILDTIASRAQLLPFYRFESAPKQELLWAKFEGLSLAKRFAFAKEWSEDPVKKDEVFSQLLAEGRLRLHSSLQTGSSEVRTLQKKLKLAQELKALCAQTEISPKLALERLFLEIP